MRKRLSAILLTVFVIMTMAVSAFADFTPPTPSVGNPNCEHYNLEWGDYVDDYLIAYWEICTDCGYTSEASYDVHYYEEDCCVMCGHACTHSSVTNSRCDYCNTEIICEHAYLFDFGLYGICYKCGYECPHPNSSINDFGQCGDCLMPHPLYETAYQNGKADGVTEGYANGKADGVAEGYTNGYAEGEADGYTNGKAEGYTNGYAEGEADGYTNGKAEGYTNGYNDGRIQGQADDVGNMLPTMFDGLFDSVGGFMNVFLNLGIGGITIGALLGLTLTVLLVLLVVKIIRGS